jgi:hypothetical protein
VCRDRTLIHIIIVISNLFCRGTTTAAWKARGALGSEPISGVAVVVEGPLRPPVLQGLEGPLPPLALQGLEVELDDPLPPLAPQGLEVLAPRPWVVPLLARPPLMAAAEAVAAVAAAGVVPLPKMPRIRDTSTRVRPEKPRGGAHPVNVESQPRPARPVAAPRPRRPVAAPRPRRPVRLSVPPLWCLPGAVTTGLSRPQPVTGTETTKAVPPLPRSRCGAPMRALAPPGGTSEVPVVTTMTTNAEPETDSMLFLVLNWP